MPYTKIIQSLGRIYLDSFLSGQDIPKQAAKFDSIRHAMVELYDLEVKKGMTKVEDLTPDEKNQLWSDTLELGKGILKKDQLIELSKALCWLLNAAVKSENITT